MPGYSDRYWPRLIAPDEADEGDVGVYEEQPHFPAAVGSQRRVMGSGYVGSRTPPLPPLSPPSVPESETEPCSVSTGAAIVGGVVVLGIYGGVTALGYYAGKFIGGDKKWGYATAAGLVGIPMLIGAIGKWKCKA